jgi:hypothetical protein
MDWNSLSLAVSLSQTLEPPRVAPASPSSGASDDPGFRLRRSRRAQTSAAGLQPLLPPALCFPEPATYWTV